MRLSYRIVIVCALCVYMVTPAEPRAAGTCYLDAVSAGFDAWLTSAPSGSVVGEMTVGATTYPGLVALDWGAGRVVVGPGNTMTENGLNVGSTVDTLSPRGRLIVNALLWTTRKSDPTDIRVLLANGHREMINDANGGVCTTRTIDGLNALGFQTTLVSRIPSDPAVLAQYDAVLLPGVGWSFGVSVCNPTLYNGSGGPFTTAEINALQQFIQNGGGFVASAELYAGTWLNNILAPTGVAFSVRGTNSPLLIERTAEHPLWAVPCPNSAPAAVATATPSVASIGLLIALDGSGSSDPDSTPGTNDDIVAFTWILDANGDGTPDASDPEIAVGEQVQITSTELGLGSHRIFLEVRDSQGETDVAEVVVDVVATTPVDVFPPVKGWRAFVNHVCHAQDAAGRLQFSQAQKQLDGASKKTDDLLRNGAIGETEHLLLQQWVNGLRWLLDSNGAAFADISLGLDCPGK